MTDFMFPPIGDDDNLTKDAREREPGDECINGFCPMPTPRKVVIDEVNPAHYQQGGMEAIDVMEAFSSKEEFQGYLRLNAVKYLLRLNNKGSAALNSKKALWYVDRLSKELSE
jgi:hypothetical protein